MIYLYMLALALLLMLPLFFSFSRRSTPRGRRDTALALHRAQLNELVRDLEQERIAPAEYAAAKLEVERRLLAADTLAEMPPGGSAKFLLFVTTLLIPVMAFLLYIPGSTPRVPSEPHAKWVAMQNAQQAQAAVLIMQLRSSLSKLDPTSAQASEGQAYLAEVLAEQAGAITPESLALFRQSIANAPATAPWRKLDEARLAEATSPAD